MNAIRMGVTLAASVAGILGTSWATVEVRAQATQDPVIHACAGDDGVLRLTPLDQACPSGQRSMLFKRAESDLDAPKSDDEPAKKADACPAVDKDAIAALENRLKALEGDRHGTTGPSRVVAPFEVVDRKGQPIFQVAEEGSGGTRFVLAYNSGGVPVAGMRATNGGGLLWGEAASRDRRVLVGAGTSFAGLDVEEGAADSGNNRLQLGRLADTGHYSLRFKRDGAKTIAGIGESRGGGGVAVIADQEGRIRASVSVNATGTGGGEFLVEDAERRRLASLTSGKNGGQLVLFSNSGEPMVDAGVVDSGFGVVRAGPGAFKSGVGLLGLPGSYIAGKPN